MFNNLKNKLIVSFITAASLSLIVSDLSATPAFRNIPNKNIQSDEKEPLMAVFTPPSGWMVADKEFLSAHVKILVIGPKIKNDMPPTMNLMIEPFKGDLKDYLKNVKKINESHGDAWKDLGNLKTKAGDANLSQVEVSSKWGGEKLMHAIIVKNGYAYVLTATASKNEFGRFYQQFYNSLKSLQIYNDLYAVVNDSAQRNRLEAAVATLKSAFKSTLPSSNESLEARQNAFKNEDFQEHYWKPFQDMLKKDYSQFGQEWQNTVSDDIQEDLLKS